MTANDSVSDQLSRARAVVDHVNAAYPGRACVEQGPEVDVSVMIYDDDPHFSDGLTALLTGLLGACTSETLEERTFRAGGVPVVLRREASVTAAMRMLAAVLLDLDTRTGGTLLDVLAGSAPVPDVLLDATPWERVELNRDDMVDVDLEAVTGNPGAMLNAWVEQAITELPYSAPVPLDLVGDVLATLLTDIAVARGWDPTETFEFDAIEIVQRDVVDAACEGRSVLATARGLATDRPVVRVPASTRDSGEGVRR